MSEKTELLNVLVDVKYAHSMNMFEEEYGINVSYKNLEQSSYVELKHMVNEGLGRKIKFRKHDRDIGEDKALTVRAEMTELEYEEFLDRYKEGEYVFLCDFVATNIRILEPETETE